jgi:RNA polymerase sigma-70 factor, ECF subfamily
MDRDKNVRIIKELLERPEQRSRLLRAAARIVPEDAEDAVQDGLVQALANAGSFRQAAQTSTWLYRVVINAALMRRRKAHRAAHYTQAATRCAGDAPWATGGPGSEPPDQLLSRRQEVARVRAAVDSLPAGYREAVEDCLLADRDPHEAASDLGITKSCLRTRVTRARQQLASRLHRAA